MKRLIGVALPILFAAISGACSDPSSPVSSIASPPPATPTAGTPRPVTAPPPEPTPTSVTFAQACTVDVLTRFMQNEYDRQGAGQIVIKAVGIENCRNDYAHISVGANLADGSPADGVEVWLHFVGGQWRVVKEGTDVSCKDTSGESDFATACGALGED